MIRLIGIDVDGTLLDSEGQMPAANRDAIHDAVAAGVHVALVTGRSYPFARPVAERCPRRSRSSSATARSSAATDGIDAGTTAARPRCGASGARRDAADYRDAAALVFDRDADRQIVFETMDWEHPGRQKYWARNNSHIAQSVPLEDALAEDPIQVMFNGAVHRMRPLAELLRQDAAFAPLRRGSAGLLSAR